MRKSDIIAALIIGEADAWLIILIAKNIREALVAYPNFQSLINFLPIILPILAVLAVFFSHFIGKKILVIFQIVKFALVGTLNAFIDLGVLNLLILVSGIATGFLFSVFKGISFLLATINSYFWNKFWTFRKRGTAPYPKEFLQFFVITVIGFLINVGTASLIVNVFGPQFGMTENLWANVGAIFAAIIAAIWNFLGYKFLVFKK